MKDNEILCVTAVNVSSQNDVNRRVLDLVCALHAILVNDNVLKIYDALWSF